MFGKKQVVAILIVLLVGVGIFLLPKQSAKVKESVPEATANHEHDSKLDRAVAMVQGDNPMQGIMLLREVLEEDSTNVEALMYMGLFSVQSGQLDKARERFETVLRYESDQLDAHWQLGQLDFDQSNYGEAAEHFKVCAESGIQEYQNAWFFMGRSYELNENYEAALKAYNTFRPMTTDTVITKKLDEFITNLNNIINQ